MKNIDVKELISQGYRCVSRKYGIVSRVDRHDWIPFLANDLSIPIELLSDLYKKGKGCDYADHYRRCYSKDKLELGPALGHLFPTSGWDPVGYIPKAGEKVQVKVETFVHPNINVIEQLTTMGDDIHRYVLDIQEAQAQEALHKLGWYQIKKTQLNDDPIVRRKLETKLHKWFDKRFTSKYFTFRLKERDEYLQSCARELSNALRNSIREWLGRRL